jgi:DNA-3-methyladenine glycosylase
MERLTPDFFIRDDLLTISRELIGKYIFSRINEELTGGIITEVEAYEGVTDRASHAYGGRRTRRNEIMYAAGGVAYVYFCYGMHYMLNFVTNVKDVPHAILLRGIKPTEGLDIMKARRRKLIADKNFTKGPGTVTQALGINMIHNGVSLDSNIIWLEDRGMKFPDNEIHTGKRIGVAYAGEDANLPYRFWID